MWPVNWSDITIKKYIIDILCWPLWQNKSNMWEAPANSEPIRAKAPLWEFSEPSRAVLAPVLRLELAPDSDSLAFSVLMHIQTLLKLSWDYFTDVFNKSKPSCLDNFSTSKLNGKKQNLSYTHKILPVNSCRVKQVHFGHNEHHRDVPPPSFSISKHFWMTLYLCTTKWVHMLLFIYK